MPNMIPALEIGDVYCFNSNSRFYFCPTSHKMIITNDDHTMILLDDHYYEKQFDYENRDEIHFRQMPFNYPHLSGTLVKIGISDGIFYVYRNLLKKIE